MALMATLVRRERLDLMVYLETRDQLVLLVTRELWENKAHRVPLGRTSSSQLMYFCPRRESQEYLVIQDCLE